MLHELRNTLLRLHKVLVDVTREQIEAETGTALNPHQWWHMLSRDDRFAWLNPFTRMIVPIDESLGAPEPVPAALATLADEVRVIIRESRMTEPYQTALQHSPDALLAHADVLACLGSQPPPPRSRS